MMMSCIMNMSIQSICKPKLNKKWIFTIYINTILNKYWISNHSISFIIRFFHLVFSMILPIHKNIYHDTGKHYSSRREYLRNKKNTQITSKKLFEHKPDSLKNYIDVCTSLYDVSSVSLLFLNTYLSLMIF